jgi:S-formylglutathione hydrolase FrmB
MRRLLVGVAVLVVAAFVVRALLATDTHGARVQRFEVKSSAVHRTLPVTAVVPEGAGDDSRRALVVYLHGRGSDGHDSNLSREMYAALERLGDRAPVMVFPNGGVSSYWHDRRDGRWERYVLRELIPQALRRLPVDRRRVAIGGASMGGFGALNIGRRHPGLFCAVGAHSPALWRSGGETAPGAFDDAEDFTRNDVIGTARSDPAAFAAQPLWIDSGLSDPFDPGVRAMVDALRAGGVPARMHRWPGGHDARYTNAHWDDYLRFYARSCA